MPTKCTCWVGSQGYGVNTTHPLSGRESESIRRSEPCKQVNIIKWIEVLYGEVPGQSRGMKEGEIEKVPPGMILVRRRLPEDETEDSAPRNLGGEGKQGVPGPSLSL